MATETKTPEEMNLKEVVENIIIFAKANSAPKVDQLMSHFQSKVSSTGRAVLRTTEALVEGNKRFLGKETYDEMLSKIQTYM